MIAPAATQMQPLHTAAIFLRTEQQQLVRTTTPTVLSGFFLFVFLTHLPSMRDTKLILREPKNAPRPYRETMSDQIMVTMCGGGVSSYLSIQLLLMKLWMNCVVKVQIHCFRWVSMLTFGGD